MTKEKLTSTYEPPALEILLTLSIGSTILVPYYAKFIQGMKLQGDEKVLDFGSGSGICTRHIAAALDQKNGELMCVDISKKWMRIIRWVLNKYTQIIYRCGYINELDIPNNYFDLITIHFVLHEIPEREQLVVLRSLAEKLNCEGKIVLRESIGHGLTYESIEILARESRLCVSKYVQHRIKPVGEVMDITLRRYL